MFTQFDVYQGANRKSCSDDFLEVRSGLTDISPQIGGKYCNGNRTLLITTRGNMVRIYFHSGSASLAHKGFQIHYLSVIPGIINNETYNFHLFSSCMYPRRGGGGGRGLPCETEGVSIGNFEKNP